MQVISLSSIIRKANELLTEDHWIKHVYASKKKGELDRVISALSPEATCFCSIGLLIKAAHMMGFQGLSGLSNQNAAHMLEPVLEAFVDAGNRAGLKWPVGHDTNFDRIATMNDLLPFRVVKERWEAIVVQLNKDEQGEVRT